MSSYKDWLPRADAVRLVRKEAELTARALGHDLEPWAMIGDADGSYRFSVCTRCEATATVRGRSFNHPALSGPALTMRCEPHAKDRLRAAREKAGLPVPVSGPVYTHPGVIKIQHAAPSPTPAYGLPPLPSWGPLGPHTPPRKP